MAAAPASCAVSTPHKETLGPAPHLVHVRFDGFLVAGEGSGRWHFRTRLRPAPLDEVYAALRAFTPAIDGDSNCGFYLNFFGSPLLQNDFSGTLRRLQLEVLKNTGVAVSIGAANSKVAAAAASRAALPGELRLIHPGSEAEFLATLHVEALHAMGGIDACDLRRRGVGTIAELRRVPRPKLISVYGELLGRRIWRNSRGLDALPASYQTAAAPPRGWLRAAAAAFAAAL